MTERITVAELFAGVGGFRLGLEGHPDSEEDTGFKVVFSNQWEPGEKAQWASKVYQERFGYEGHTGNSIHDFTHPKEGISEIPEHDLLVGGFPCQDYSVARTISGELGIKGEKGKLWVHGYAEPRVDEPVDPDHFGAHIGEQHGAHGVGANAGQFDYFVSH